MGVVLLGVGVGVGLAWYTQRPVLVEQHTGAFLLFAALVLALAWFGGKRYAGRQAATAIAQAHADARASVDADLSSVAGAQSVVNLHLGERRGDQLVEQLSSASWYGERDQHADVMEQLSEQTEGDGVGQLLDEREPAEVATEDG